MNYDNWIDGKEIPTIRRLDYIVEGINNMESGFLYAALRKMSYLKFYNSQDMSDETKDAEFKADESFLKEKLDWINDWMSAHNRDKIFTDTSNWRNIGKDFDYYWELRTKEQFIKEEVEARVGKSNRKPIDHECDEYEEKINELVEKFKKSQEAPSLDD